MLPIPIDTNNTVNIIGIDPGSTTLGVAVLTINVETMQIVSNEAFTLNGNKLGHKNSWCEELHGSRYYRISLIEENLLKIFNYYQPIAICSESPFINGKFPAAGIALTEVLCTIRRAVTMYDQWRILYLIPPSCLKQAVFAKGNADKDSMKLAVINIHELANTNINGIHTLDEHSVDALACAYSQYLVYKNSTMPLV